MSILEEVGSRYPAVDLAEAMGRRHSVRAYRPDPVPEEVLMALLDAAQQAPSSNNLQPCEFVVVTSPEAKEALVPAVTGHNDEVVRNAGATFVCLASLNQLDALANRLEQNWLTPDVTPERRERVARTLARLREDEEWRRSHVVANSYIGIANLVLAAWKFGLASLWMGGFDSAKVAEAVGVPDTHVVAALVAVGWGNEPEGPKPRKRRPLAETYFMNRYGSK